MRVLGLDLGTKTGYCFGETNSPIPPIRGTWTLATAKEITAWGKDRSNRRKDPRVERLCQLISDLAWFDIIIFEDVQFASYTQQVQLWSSLRSAVWLCGKAKIVECVPVGTLKLFAANHGGATKEMMMVALKRKMPHLYVQTMDDNAVDAAWLWVWAANNLKRSK